MLPSEGKQSHSGAQVHCEEEPEAILGACLGKVRQQGILHLHLQHLSWWGRHVFAFLLLGVFAEYWGHSRSGFVILLLPTSGKGCYLPASVLKPQPLWCAACAGRASAPGICSQSWWTHLDP